MFLRWPWHVLIPMIVLASAASGLNGWLAHAKFSQAPSVPPQNDVAERNQRQPDALIGTEANPAVIEIAKSPADAAKEQRDEQRQSNSLWWSRASVVSAGTLAFALFVVGVLQLRTHAAQVATTHEIERAYIDLSHTPDGFHEVGADTGRFAVTIQVCNRGNTPATVTDGWLRVTPVVNGVNDWPHPQMRGDYSFAGGFLVREKQYRSAVVMALSTADAALVRNGSMYLVGWVLYEDRFKRRHRVGYARWIAPHHAATNNLLWTEDSARGNYDVEIDENSNPKNS